VTDKKKSTLGRPRVFTELLDTGVRSVLVVDDEESIRLSMGKFLRSRGYHVVTADAGAAALALLQAEKFDVLLCDIRMPDMTGLEVVPRAIEIAPDLAVLMLTAVNDAPTATEALAQGAMDYLMKPIEFADLARAVERALVKRDLEIHQRTVERFVREEVALRTADIQQEQSVLVTEVIDMLCSIADAREEQDPFRYGHSRRVATLAVAIAAQLGLVTEVIEQLRTSARLHDIGKIGVPGALLIQASPLSTDDIERVRAHVRLGVEIVGSVSILANALPGIASHHERWDGAGYPEGLKGEAIPLAARIITVADTFDALTSPRPYQPILTPDNAFVRLRETAGTQHDPAVIDALGIVMHDSGTLPLPEPRD
jgi:putative two-component system response regulator